MKVRPPARTGCPTASSVSRRDLSRLMAEQAAEIGADAYLLVEMTYERGREQVVIVASNWIYDAVEDIGLDGIAALTVDEFARLPGEMPRAVVVARNPQLGKATASTLIEHGHHEFFCQRLHAGKRRVYAFFSAAQPKRMDADAAARAQMTCGYAFARYAGDGNVETDGNPLSERERECLRWVSEGKTTDEVALILGVSSNTVNSYVMHAIQKFGATNRAMAIATAIRGGVI